MPSRHHLLIALLGLIWGSNFIFMKWAAATLSAGQITFLRIAFGFLPVLAFALMRGEIRCSHLRHWPHFLVMSALATSFYYFAFAKGTALLPSGIAGALSGAIPLFAFIAAFFFLRSETITARKGLGVALGFAGVVMLARPWATGNAEVAPLGIFYMIAGSLSVGVSFVYAKKFVTPLAIGPVALTSYQIGLALVSLALVTDYSGITGITADLRALLGLVFGLGLAGTGLAYILYYIIVETQGAIAAASVTYIPPAVALFIGWAFVGEPIGPLDGLAMLIILTGVVLLRPTGRSLTQARKGEYRCRT